MLPVCYTSSCKGFRPARAVKSFPQQLYFLLHKTVLIGGIAVLYLCSHTAAAQSDDYKKVITERSAKIVNTLGITDSVKYKVVLNKLVSQYAGLNDIHENNKQAVAAIKKQALSKEEMDQALQKQAADKTAQLSQLHNAFLLQLKENLQDADIEKIKDGMTYRVFPITYGAYQDMIPALTTEQKDKIYVWLKEARELAMDEGSSDDKHKVFGKYKGRINNYLSAAGYDLKKETEDWQKRLKEKQPGQ